MNDRQFWKVVKTLNWNSTGDDHAVIEPAVELLSKTSDEEIFEFEALLYIARNAYERKNNKEWNYCSPTSYETYQNEKGWK